ncbi:DUF4194 domain-containing protein [Antribacter gilvus]|uniref:DUF4194 domain-containing protein n=1 Tax=Antribacter gilvus TaxID=2304675 RepID=UPI001F0BDF81|nr:DUF4194 domain-containing protein [Antribacter gilvus]
MPDAGRSPSASAPPPAGGGAWAATTSGGPDAGAEPPASGHDEVTALWTGDTGTLRAPTRSALALLVRGPYLSADRDAAAWRALLADEDQVRSRLADLYLDLVLDVDTQVAFVRTARGGAVSAVREQPLTFLDTAVLLHLRGCLLDTAGERAVVSRADVGDALAGLRKRSGVDATDFVGLLDASWSRLVERGLLEPSGADRYEVSPVLRVLFGADEVAAVQAEYARLAKEGA